MKKVDGVDLSELVKETATAVLSEKRKGIAGLVKELMQKSESLAKEIEKGEIELNKKKANLTAVNDKLKKLGEGDWSVLQDIAPPQ